MKIEKIKEFNNIPKVNEGIITRSIYKFVENNNITKTLVKKNLDDKIKNVKLTKSKIDEKIKSADRSIEEMGKKEESIKTSNSKNINIILSNIKQ